MKLNCKRSLFRILWLAVLFCLVFTACTPQIAPSSSNVETPSSQVSSGEPVSGTPEGTKSGFDGRTSFWCDLQFPGIPHRRMEGVDEEVSQTVREIDYSGGELKANFFVINELANDETDVLEMGLFIFCDGVPIEYTLLDSGKTGIYEVLRVEGEEMNTFQLAFTPDFDLNLGRIDFHLVAMPNEMADWMLRSRPLPFHAVLPEGYTAQGTHKDVIGNVKDGQIAAMPDGIKKIRSGMPRMFLMDPEIEEKRIGTGGRRFRIGEQEETWICTYAPVPGKYRLVFLLDGKPLALEDGKTVLNCEFTKDDEMFSAIVPLKQMIPPGQHSLMAIATRIDDQSFQTALSCCWLSSNKWDVIN